MQIMGTQKELINIFEIKNLGKYHDFYVLSNTLLLADVFRNMCRNMCIKVYKLDPAKNLFSSWLKQRTALRNIEIKLDLLTNIVCY